jgi:O-antigen/teichoic acid export membrane protein
LIEKKENTRPSFFSDSLSIFVVRALNTLAGLVAIIYFSHTLAKSVYGQFQNFLIYLTVTTAVAGLGFSLLILTYSPQQLKTLLSSINRKKQGVYIGFVVGIAVIFASLCFRHTHQSFLEFLGLALFMWCYVFGQLFESLLIVLKKYKILMVGNLLYALAYVGICIQIVNVENSIGTLALSLIPAIFVKSGLFGFVSKRHLSRIATVQHPELNLQHTKSLWVQLAIYDLTAILFTWIDKFILSFIIGAAAVASYNNATMNIPFIGIIISAAGGAALMQFHQAKLKSEKIHILNKMGKMLSCVAFPLFFFFLFFRNEFIEVAFSSRYLDIVPIFVASILILPARAYNHTAIIQHYHKGKIMNIGAILDLCVALALMGPFYKLWGLPGVALSFVVSTYLQALFYLHYAAKLLGTKPWHLVPIYNWMGKAVFFAGIGFITAKLLNKHTQAEVALCAGAAIIGICALITLRWESRN